MNRVKGLIKERGYSQNHIATRVLLITPRALRYKLAGQRKFTKKDRERLAEFFGLPESEIFLNGVS